MKEIPCSVKFSTFMGVSTGKVGSLNSKNLHVGGCQVMQILFPQKDHVDIGSITFTNRFTALLTIKGRVKVSNPANDASFKLTWSSLVDSKKLMKDPHSALDGEARVSIHASEFATQGSQICALMFILQQPSVSFTDFGVDNIRIYAPDTNSDEPFKLPGWLTKENATLVQEERTIRNCPPIDEISRLMHKMWILGRKSSELKPPSHLRFDKDGCYEINLLTYT